MQRLLIAFSLSLLLLSCNTPAKPRNAESKLIADVEPVKVARIGIGFERLFSKDLDKAELGVFFHPRTNEASLDYFWQLNKHRILLSESNRKVLEEGIIAYLKAYDDRSLNIAMKSGKSMQSFGSTDIWLQWGAFSYKWELGISMMIGYRFIDRTPYFTLRLPRTYNPDQRSQEEKSGDYSLETVLYFSKAQAAALGESLMQDALMAALDPVDRKELKEEKEEYKPK